GGMSMVGLRQIARIDFEGPAMTAGLGGASSGPGAFGGAPASGGGLFSDAARGLASSPAPAAHAAGNPFAQASAGAPPPSGNPFAQASAGAPPPSGNPFAQAGAPASGNPFAQASKGMAPLPPAPAFPIWRTLIGGAGVA